jgi:hypothetical protein
MFQLCFNLNRIHDSVGKALRTADQDHVTANSHPRLIRGLCWRSNADMLINSAEERVLCTA